MRQYLLYIAFCVSLLLGSAGEAMARQQQKAPAERDRVQRVEQRENHGEAMVSDAQNLYRICNSRPQRIVPVWGADYAPGQAQGRMSTLTNYKYFQFLQLLYRGAPREESAPIHFEVACRYYVICLRRLLC